MLGRAVRGRLDPGREAEPKSPPLVPSQRSEREERLTQRHGGEEGALQTRKQDFRLFLSHR